MNNKPLDLGEQSEVEVFGARVHKLKNIDVSNNNGVVTIKIK